MPLLPGKKNIGHNIKVEENHDKPKKQAVAIALRKAGVPKKASDDLAPVGAEDPERALALAKHAAGITKSQDKGAKDGALNAELDQAREAKEALKHKIETVEPVGAGFGEATVVLAKLASKVMALEKQATQTNKIRPVGDATLVSELPTPIKTSNLVPMPSGEHNEERYAPRPVGDGYKAPRASSPEWTAVVQELSKVRRALAASSEGSPEEKQLLAKMKELEAKKNATPARAKATDSKVVLPEQRSGSAPADHMHRAAQYEINGDRAQALDSYRAAASGYRKANDRANETKARDGVEACQALFSGQYGHPGAGRVKVCDSAEQAARTAIERTRAGESVFVTGKTVRPGRANDAALPKKDKLAYKALKQEPEAHETNDDTGGPPPVDEPAYPGMPDPVRTDDEHEGFKKLEGRLSHEKGVSDPGALAASIGRKKYGAAGMAKKAAAGRAKDQEVQPV